MMEQQHPTLAATGQIRKACHRCGKDLTRQARYRDRSGYWCVPCNRTEESAYRANHLPCDDCGQDVRRGQEMVLEDWRLCPVCYQKRQVRAVRERMAAEAKAQRKERTRWSWRAARNWGLVAAELVAACLVLRLLASSDDGPAAGPRREGATTAPALVASGQPAPSSPPAAAPQTHP